MTDEVLADQVDYYRRRAGEYDVTAYGDVTAARARIARLVAEMRPAGSVLEIACGTGLWTEALAGWADTVTAIDAAPEAVAIARDRVRPASVSFEVADVFSWDPGTRFDVIFFSAWLSHVPVSRFGQFSVVANAVCVCIHLDPVLWLLQVSVPPASDNPCMRYI